MLPCLNEAESLPAVLAAIPDGYQVLVVDNNSTDDTVEVALRHGARVVTEPRPGYGSAVHAGVVAATTPIVAVIDADGSLDPGELPGWLQRSRPAPTWPSGDDGRCPACTGRGSPGWARW
ncbi:glycosyl transferase 2 family protein [Mycobacterium xenopi 4042]|uniref:Glycosyl transferase 2 family protein n=1 Tax=Mycobacterium xenopi 4042 TaxID=1299334 RepID=X8CAD2_MYCXE|nr:glycosyl transferase 2 family protein [Mycobacterium xenopi 4042]